MLDTYDKDAHLTANQFEEEEKSCGGLESFEEINTLARSHTANNELFYHFIFNDVLKKQRTNIDNF